MSKVVLVTGGAGYIGSHVCIELLKQDFQVIVYDNPINSSIEALRRVELITQKKIDFIKGDICDIYELGAIMKRFKPDFVMHFAGLKSVSESAEDPLRYFEVNVGGSINLLQVMQTNGCNQIVFSSSATVYDDAIDPLILSNIR